MRRSRADFVEAVMVMVICFGTAPIVHVRGVPAFMPLMPRDRSSWPRCLLWHGWLPVLSTAGERDPWAACLDHLADRSLERGLGAYPMDEA